MKTSTRNRHHSRKVELVMVSLLALSTLACFGSDSNKKKTQRGTDHSEQTNGDPTQFAARSLMGAMGPSNTSTTNPRRSPSTIQPRGLPRLTKHYKTGLYYPAGWYSKSSSKNSISTLSFTNKRGALLALMAVPKQKVSSTQLLKIYLGQFKNIRVKSSKKLKGGVFAEFQGIYKKSGTPVNFVTMTSTGNKTSMIAFFQATPNSYYSHGGSRLLLAMFGATGSSSSSSTRRTNTRTTPTPRRTTPTPRRTTTRTTPKRNSLDYADGVHLKNRKTQEYLLNNPPNKPAMTIFGGWLGGGSEKAPTGVGGAQTTIGTGVYLTFSNKGTYSLGYSYSQTSNGCKNKISNGEVGAYNFDGRKLVLQPKSNTITTRPCGQAAVKKKFKGGKPKTYEVSFTSLGNGMILRGTCPSYARASCLGPSSSRYWQLGLKKLRSKK